MLWGILSKQSKNCLAQNAAMDTGCFWFMVQLCDLHLLCLHRLIESSESLYQTILLQSDPFHRNFDALFEAAVYFLVSIPPQTSMINCPVHRICWTFHIHTTRKHIFATFMAPSNIYFTRNSISGTYGPSRSSLLPQTGTKRFFSTREALKLVYRKYSLNASLAPRWSSNESVIHIYITYH